MHSWTFGTNLVVHVTDRHLFFETAPTLGNMLQNLFRDPTAVCKVSSTASMARLWRINATVPSSAVTASDGDQAPSTLCQALLEEQGASFRIRDAAGRILAYVYFENEPTRRNFSKRLSKNDARRMAQLILRLPELVRIAKGIDPSEA